MKKIEAYLRPAVIGEGIAALHGMGIEGLSLTILAAPARNFDPLR